MKAKVFALTIGLFAPQLAWAHGFGRMYNLPVPLWLYLYGAAAALALSFVVAALLVTRKMQPKAHHDIDLGQAKWLQWARRWHVLTLFQSLSVFLLGLSIATGIWGNRNPYINFNMTFFWVIFVLGYAYLTVLIGNTYSLINPWQVMAQWLNKLRSGFSQGVFAYPLWLSYWPAVALYMAFIWVELFAHNTPRSLAEMLIAYTVINLVAVALFGAKAWFRYGEFFSVFFRLTAKMSPLDIAPGRLRLRTPLVGLLDSKPERMVLVVFVLFMLSATAFDGLRETRWWVSLFWADKFNILTPLLGSSPVYHFHILRPYYLLYESAWLLLSPFLYLLIYVFFMALTKWVARSSLSVTELSLRFAYTLLPIAVVYNITHYYTLIFTQGVKIVSMLSDPFGWGWNLFGTVGLWRAPILPDMGLVWHTQVGLIVLGHVISVYLAHVQALRCFGSRAQATLSQLPMLVLMMAFTASGLWILGQPISD